MYKNYLLIAFRNFRKDKVFTVINLSGLTISLAICLLTLLYVGFELSYDRFHENADRLYRITTANISNGEEIQDANTSNLVGPTLKATLPEVEDFARIYLIENATLSNGDRHFKEDRLYVAEPSFLQMFSWKMLAGDTKTALEKPLSVVLTQSAARQYFGDEDPVGQTLIYRDYGNQDDLLVTGVMADVPENSHLHFNMLISYTTATDHWKRKLTWDNNNDYTYLLVDPQAKRSSLSTKAKQVIDSTNRFNTSYVWQLVEDIHLHSHKTYEAEANGSATTVYGLLALALLVMLIACFNYINLATVQSMHRIKESSIRKVLGASRGALILQFLTESLTINAVALLLAIALVVMVKSYFELLAGHALSFELLERPDVFAALLGLLLLGTLASCLFPAISVTAFQPVKVLKGSFTASGKGNVLRKSLVTLQFMLTIMMMGGTLLVYQQIHFLRQQETGATLSQIVALHAPKYLGNDSVSSRSFQFFRNEITQLPYVQDATFSSTLPGNGIYEINSTDDIHQLDHKEDFKTIFYLYGASDTYLQTLGINLIAGHGFRLPHASSETAQVVINKMAATRLGFASPDDALGQMLTFWGNKVTVSGVIDDYHHLSLKEAQIPLLIYPTDEAGADYFSIKLSAPTQATSYADMIAGIEDRWRTAYPNDVFDYYFLDDQFDAQYRTDQQFGQVFGIFTGFAIFIACLGLLGLATYSARQRTKEIGIRKVLGASAQSILLLLSKDYIRLILIAFAVATPVANYFAQEWLQSFAYRIDLHWWHFFIPGITVLLIALLAVSSQSLKAANSNPVDSLRNE